MLHDLFAPLFNWYNGYLTDHGYVAVVILMAMESSIIPLPSEAIIPPAMLVAQKTGNMTAFGIVIAGTIGSWIGATAMYWASRWAGRPLVLRFGKYFLVSPAKVEMAEQWSKQYGNFGVFISRLLPVVRHLIGIPAGIVRLDFIKFSIFTVIGSALWCAILCWVGIQAGKDEALMKGELHRITLWAIGALVILGAIYYVFVHRVTRKKKAG
jgi:membrane protein DedA with SNARE-associated domain